MTVTAWQTRWFDRRLREALRASAVEARRQEIRGARDYAAALTLADLRGRRTGSPLLRATAALVLGAALGLLVG